MAGKNWWAIGPFDPVQDDDLVSSHPYLTRYNSIHRYALHRRHQESDV